MPFPFGQWKINHSAEPCELGKTLMQESNWKEEFMEKHLSVIYSKVDLLCVVADLYSCIGFP